VLAAAALTAFAEFDSAEQLAGHILKTRGEPLRRIDGLTELFLRDFGAVADDDRNDLPALQKAAAQITATGGHTILRFEKGRYIFDPGGGKYQGKRDEPPMLRIDRLKNVIVDGQGSEIIIKRPSAGFCEVRESQNIIIRNFTIDYDPLPFSQGTVVGLDAKQGWMDVQADPGFPGLDDPLFTAYGSFGMLKDPAHPGKLKDGAPNVLFRSSCTPVSNRICRIQLQPAPGGWLKKGDRYAQVSRPSGCCSYFDSEQVTFENITFYAVPGSLFVGSGTAYLNVLNCRSVLKDGRLLLSGADGVHCQGARVGPWIEGCDFEGLSDDCLNIYCIPVYIREILSPERIRITGSAKIKAGDALAFFRPQTGEVPAEVTVVSVEKDIVTLSGPVSGLNIAPPGTPFDQRGWKIYDHIYNMSATGNYFVYRNNYMHDGRRYGAFIKGSYGLIESNRFERLSDSALFIKNEPNWPEGGWACNLVIRGNRASGCATTGRIPVQIGWLKLPHQSAGFPMQKNIFFEDNTIVALSGPAAELNCIDGLVLTGNTFESGTSGVPLVTGQNTTVRNMTNNTPEIEFE
jgi:hypothetical protein